MSAAEQVQPEGVHEVPIADVHVIRGRNPRRTFDEAKLQELAEDIGRRGVLQNLIGRPREKGGVELVVGERRLRASKLAGRSTVPMAIVAMSDAQVLETMLVENAQRADVEPLEEAEAYRALMRDHGYTADDLGAKLGKSRSWIYGRLKLLELSEEVREALAKGDITVSVAMALGRLRVEVQEEALEEVAGRGDMGPLSYRAAVETIEEQFACRLKDARWKLDDPELVPEAGPCSTCEKRSGNQPELLDVGGKRPDVCMDRLCFAEKQKAWGAQQLAEAREKGRQVLDPGEAEKALGHGSGARSFVKADERDWRDAKHRTWRQVTKAKPEDVVLAVEPRSGKVVELLPTKGIDDRIRKAGNRYLDSAKKPSGEKGPDRAAQVARGRLERETKRRFLDAVRAGIGREGATSEAIVRLLVREISGGCWSQAAQETVQRFGLLQKKPRAQDAVRMLESKAATAPLEEAVALVLDVLAQDDRPWRQRVGSAELAKAFGIDRGAIARQVKADAKKLAGTKANAKAPAKKAAAKRRKAAPRTPRKKASRSKSRKK